MLIRSPALQSAQGQAVRHQPVVAGDRVRDAIRDRVTDAAIKRVAVPDSTVAFSQEAMKAAVLDKAGVKAGDPEAPANSWPNSTSTLSAQRTLGWCR